MNSAVAARLGRVSSSPATSAGTLYAVGVQPATMASVPAGAAPAGSAQAGLAVLGVLVLGLVAFTVMTHARQR